MGAGHGTDGESFNLRYYFSTLDRGDEVATVTGHHQSLKVSAR